MIDTIRNVLFLCTGNSARSIIGEVLLNNLGAGRFRAYSAGSHPKGVVHPMAIATLGALGFDVSGASSKSWDVFAAPEAPRFDFIVTVCDNAAGEICPVWIGHPTTTHWGIEDPAAVDGGDSGGDQRQAFLDAIGFMRQRIEAFLALPLDELDQAATGRALGEIARMEGASLKTSLGAETPA